MNLAGDLASRANNQALLAHHGVVQLSANINDFGRNSARDFASGSNQDFFSCQVAFNDAIDHGFGRYKKHPLDGNAIADNDAFK